MVGTLPSEGHGIAMQLHEQNKKQIHVTAILHQLVCEVRYVRRCDDLAIENKAFSQETSGACSLQGFNSNDQKFKTKLFRKKVKNSRQQVLAHCQDLTVMIIKKN